ncbi:hypothetical protein BGX30_007671, partial [Mortierella sp. GBA39]
SSRQQLFAQWSKPKTTKGLNAGSALSPTRQNQLVIPSPVLGHALVHLVTMLAGDLVKDKDRMWKDQEEEEE